MAGPVRLPWLSAWRGHETTRIDVAGERHHTGIMKKRLLFLLWLSLGLCAVPAAFAQNPGQRFALLIGNANYPDASAPLAAPPKNVRALADELRRSGFDVDVKENLGREEMQRAIDAFKQKIKPGAAALFSFSGYGLQANRQTFILPINAPQNMVCLATETFTAKQFAKVGIVLTIVGYLLLLLFAATWWRWLGWI